MKNLKALEKIYKANKQYLPFESHYEDNGKLTAQECYIVEPKQDRCLVCVRIQTFKNLYDYQYGHTPYLQYDQEYNEFVVTIPKFCYLTKELIANALWAVKKELDGLFFNIQLDGENYNQYVTSGIKWYKHDREDLKLNKELNEKISS